MLGRVSSMARQLDFSSRCFISNLTILEKIQINKSEYLLPPVRWSSSAPPWCLVLSRAQIDRRPPHSPAPHASVCQRSVRDILMALPSTPTLPHDPQPHPYLHGPPARVLALVSFSSALGHFSGKIFP